MVPGFRRRFRPDKPPALTPGNSIVVSVQNTDVDIGLRHGPKGSALPMIGNPIARDTDLGLLSIATTTAVRSLARRYYEVCQRLSRFQGSVRSLHSATGGCHRAMALPPHWTSPPPLQWP